MTEEIENRRELAAAADPPLGTSESEDPCLDGEELTIDQDWLSGFLLRWVLAEEYLALERTEGLPEERALEVLIKRDIPTLLSELARSRPDLLFRRVG